MKTFENELSIKENETRSNLGLNYERHVATSIYIGLLNAIQHTPNEGGIIVFVDRISIDQLFLHVAINDALKKIFEFMLFGVVLLQKQIRKNC